MKLNNAAYFQTATCAKSLCRQIVIDYLRKAIARTANQVLLNPNH
jgi:CRISPR/Cas system-associated protein Csm6